jgi:hypothetical protein
MARLYRLVVGEFNPLPVLGFSLLEPSLYLLAEFFLH